MENLVRANKVTVNVVGDGYKADFYRTHKHICTVNSADTAFEPTEGMTKSGVRELFRAYVIEHAEEYGVVWNPADMRTDGNIRKASYETDEDLIEDATYMILPMMKQLADSCKYPVVWKGMNHEDISAMDKTAKGTPLSAMGIVDGKYEKSGKWAWATVGFTVTMGFKDDEIYMPVKMELVSGQLKKPKMGITAFNDMVKHEIIDAGLATEEELDPPKESKKAKAEVVAEEEPVVVVVEEPIVEDTPAPKKRSRGKKNDQ
jgi:hypothetical protein